MQFKIIFLPLLFSAAAFADVNMRDAAFLKTMNEFSSPLLERTYSSRSLWQGIFGFGWCSNLERRLEVVSAGKALLKLCDRQSPVSVHKEGTNWVYQGSQGREIYDQEGRLVSVSSPKAILSYGPNGVVTMLKTEKETLNFFYQGSLRRIRRIHSSRSGTVNYRLENGDLVGLNSGPQKISMAYDAFHNLVEIRTPLSKENITYRTDVDEISSYRSSMNPCLENFRFEKVSGFELKSTAERTCPSRPLQSQIYKFTARRNQQGHLTLMKVSTVGGLNDKANLP